MTDARSGLGLDHGKGQPTINSASVGKQKLTRLFPKRSGARPTPHHRRKHEPGRRAAARRSSGASWVLSFGWRRRRVGGARRDSERVVADIEITRLFAARRKNGGQAGHRCTRVFSESVKKPSTSAAPAVVAHQYRDRRRHAQRARHHTTAELN